LAHIFFREYLQSLDILANADQNLFVLFVLMGWLHAMTSMNISFGRSSA
jgi:hypothetical protein